MPATANLSLLAETLGNMVMEQRRRHPRGFVFAKDATDDEYPQQDHAASRADRIHQMQKEGVL